MNQIQNHTSKVDQSSPKVKFDLWTLVLAAVRLAGRYGLLAFLALLLVAFVAACFQAWTVVRVAFVVMLPILLGLAVFITVGDALDD